MSTSYVGAVRKGSMAAARLHQRLHLREQVETAGGNVDVFEAIRAIDLPLLLRPLKNLLGAYLTHPEVGVLITTQRPLSIQRFTAAHELGHAEMGHEPSLDDESILRRMEVQTGGDRNFQEIEADAFASAFVNPRWLIIWHLNRQHWTAEHLRRPVADSR